jgi:hypothetical protein
VLGNLNRTKPPYRTVLITIDISKAFDAIPRHLLINKIINTGAHNNTKRWLSNYLSGRQSYVEYNGKTSRTKIFPNDVPQGSVLSPSLFNLFMHDIPQPTGDIEISSYADDITIISSHPKHKIAAQQVQPFINTLENWLSDNRLKVAPEKSTVTLLTSHTQEHKEIPNLTLCGEPIPHKPETKILGVTYNTSMSFTPHINSVTERCNKRLNALRAISGTTFGTNKETNKTVYKQYIRSVLDYASPSWAPSISDANLNSLQVVQNKALKISIGCTRTSPTEHVHHETKVLKMSDHLDMKGAQFLAAAASDPVHPNHNLASIPPAPRNIRSTPATHYKQVLESVPPEPQGANTKKHIHTAVTQQAIARLGPNSVLGVNPPLW